MEDPPPQGLECTQHKCHHIVPYTGPKTPKRCDSCRESSRKAQATKRKHDKETQEAQKRARPNPPAEPPLLRVPATTGTEPVPQYANNRTAPQSPHIPENPVAGSNNEEAIGEIPFQDQQSMFNAIRAAFKQGKHVEFHGICQIPEDPLVTDKERVRMTIFEIWKVTGYRFRVKENYEQKTGHKTRLWCCQNQGCKQKAKPSQREGAKPRDTLGMQRFDCKSSLRVSCLSGDVSGEKKLRVYLQHHDSHLPYYDVAMLPGAADIIRESLEWHTPVELVAKVQAQFPSVTSGQVHSAWTQMSEILWKRDDMQLPSAKRLLKEFGDEVDVLDVHPAEGVEQLCWAMKKIIEPLRGKIVKIALDATYGTNSKHLELYTVMGEYDNVGFPLSYCLLSTTGSDDLGKLFIHVDKDMAEIGMARDVWNVKIQLCWWHLRRAVRTRLEKSKLSTTPYNAHCAHAEFIFIDLSFKPFGRADTTEHEGGFLASVEIVAASASPSILHANSVGTIKIPATQPRPLADAMNSQLPRESAPNAAEAMDIDEEDGSGRRTFCLVEFRQPIVDLMESHLCTHPLIPGYAHPSPAGIREWAVRQMYTFCVEHDLREVWAYLWENWYRRGRWELWARAEHPEILQLKTTMMVESHWRRIKHDFLHHFHKPRLDLLAWILIVKLAPCYYRRLDRILKPYGRDYRDLASWRKDFKAEWKKYPTSTDGSVPVPTSSPAAFWSASTLFKLSIPSIPCSSNRPLDASVAPASAPQGSNQADFDVDDGLGPCGDLGNGSDSDDNLIDMNAEVNAGRGTFDERLTSLLSTLRDFSDGIEYQRKFQDSHMLDVLEREGASFLRLAENCLSRERRVNSTRSAAPATWERSTANAMFYRTRPLPSDRDT
ncbi:hypothetical protein DFH09DRAFT_1329961 [Mycena vulgaris]|nr:hypothetical protein DFH09DRAFT_1329961 [Mycena vulgaris]